jgi:hypothetical protein
MVVEVSEVDVVLLVLGLVGGANVGLLLMVVSGEYMVVAIGVSKIVVEASPGDTMVGLVNVPSIINGELSVVAGFSVAVLSSVVSC